MSATTKAEPPGWPSYPHEVLAVVLSVRSGRLQVLLWRRREAPFRGRWALPGGGVRPDQRLRDAITAHLAGKVDVRGVAHLEQLATHSAVHRDPRARVLATAYLGLVPSDNEPHVPADTAWHPVDELPRTAFDHHFFIDAAIQRLRAKLSYTNIGFALAPEQFTIATLRDITSAALGYPSPRRTSPECSHDAVSSKRRPALPHPAVPADDQPRSTDSPREPSPSPTHSPY